MTKTRLLMDLLLMTLPFTSGCGVSNPTRSVSPTIQVIIASPTSQPTDTSLPEPAATATTIPPVLLDDFEAAQTGWTAGTDAFFPDSSAVSLALSPDHATGGRQTLQLTFEKNDKPKAIFFIDKAFDLSQAHILQFDLFNDGSAASVGIALQTGPDKTWYESDGIPVNTGALFKLSYELTAAAYKAASTNWEFTASIPDLDKVSRLAIIIYPARSGFVFIDSLRTSDTP